MTDHLINSLESFVLNPPKTGFDRGYLNALYTVGSIAGIDKDSERGLWALQAARRMLGLCR